MKKILPFRNLFVGINNAVEEILLENQYADKVIERTLKFQKKWGSKDRAFFAETVYDLVRWKRLVEAAMGEDLKPYNLWKFTGTWFIINGEKELPEWSDFKKLNHEKILANHAISIKNTAIKESVPNWLYKLGLKELGEQVWHRELEALNEQAKTVLRVNRLKTTPQDLQSKFKKDYKITSDIHPKYNDALILKEKENVFKTELFKQGFFEVQDASSQLVAPFLEAETGMRVVDVCAGAGGKTLHLSNQMNGKGQIIAMDIYGWKLKELKRRAKRNDAQNIQTKLIESPKTVKRLFNSADRLLIDAPCTGLGVLKRNPDAKWKLNQKFLNNVHEAQANILKNYCKIIKKNGLMVYATCSILPSENQKQVQRFLSENENYELLEDKTIYPSESGFDGFYMAKIRRNS